MSSQPRSSMNVTSKILTLSSELLHSQAQNWSFCSHNRQACFHLWALAHATPSTWNILRSELHKPKSSSPFSSRVKRTPSKRSSLPLVSANMALPTCPVPQKGTFSLHPTVSKRVFSGLSRISSILFFQFSEISHYTSWDQLSNMSLASNSLSQGLLLHQPKNKDIFHPVTHDSVFHSTFLSKIISFIICLLVYHLHCHLIWPSTPSPTFCIPQVPRGM